MISRYLVRGQSYGHGAEALLIKGISNQQTSWQTDTDVAVLLPTPTTVVEFN